MAPLREPPILGRPTTLYPTRELQRAASLSGTTGKVTNDSGVVAANVVTGPASSVLNRIAVFAGTTSKMIALAQYALFNQRRFRQRDFRGVGHIVRRSHNGWVYICDE